MEILYLIAIGVGGYLVADRILVIIEMRIGTRVRHRELVFFALMLVLVFGAFAVVRSFAFN